MRNSLSGVLPKTPNWFKLKKQAWNDERILVVTQEQRNQLSKLDNGVLDSIGKFLYESDK